MILVTVWRNIVWHLEILNLITGFLGKKCLVMDEGLEQNFLLGLITGDPGCQVQGLETSFVRHHIAGCCAAIACFRSALEHSKGYDEWTD